MLQHSIALIAFHLQSLERLNKYLGRFCICFCERLMEGTHIRKTIFLYFFKIPYQLNELIFHELSY